MKKDNIKDTYSLLSNIIYTWNQVKVIGKRYYVYGILYLILLIILPFSLTLLPGFIIAFIQSDNPLEIMILCIVILLTLILLANYLSIFFKKQMEWIALLLRLVYFDFLFNEKLLSCDYILTEGKENREKISAAKFSFFMGDGSGFELMIKGPILLVANIVGFLLYSAIVSSLEIWILILLIIVTTINYLMQVRARHFEHIHMQSFWANNDRFWYLKKESRELKKAKDMRIYQLQNMFSQLFQKNTKEATTIYGNVKKQTMIANIIIRITSLVRDIIVYTYLIIQMMNGILTISQFIIYVGIVYGFGSWLEEIVKNYSDMKLNNMYISKFREFITMEDNKQGFETIDTQEAHEIIFENVTFAYDNQKPIFENFNLKINRKEKLALVGINGAGKTTMMKLLCNLYPVQKGRILIDGIDIKNINRDEYFKAISIVFQEVNQFAFSIASFVSCSLNKEMITELLKQYHNMKNGKQLIDSLNARAIDLNGYDENKIIHCLKEADLWEKVKSLPLGIHTNLTKMLDKDGLLLSGGEMQKLMLARALYKDSSILILDEPTAALDPIAESEMYENYAHLCEGKTSIFISHRLSSTKFCDRIIFLEDGKIQEEGTHEELLANEGKYTQMFNVQAHYYQKEVELDEKYL